MDKLIEDKDPILTDEEQAELYPILLQLSNRTSRSTSEFTRLKDKSGARLRMHYGSK